MKNKKLILFDLDGVILDSKNNMMCSWSSVQDNLSVNIPFEDYFKNIGRPFSEIMDILGLSDISEKIEGIYKKASLENIDKISFYGDASNVLNELINMRCKIGVVTSKDTDRTKLILNKLNVNFSVIQTPNGKLRGKPSPDHLLMAMAVTNTDPEDSVYIGDMEVDYMAAMRAGIDYIHASWGYSEIGEDSIPKLKSLNELVPYLEGRK